MKDPHDLGTIDFIGVPPDTWTPPVSTTTMPDNFKDFPTVLGDVRSDMTGKGADWTPRELLLSMLKSLDSGEISADTLVAQWAWVDEEGKSHTKFLSSNKDPLRAIGLCAITLSKYTG